MILRSKNGGSMKLKLCKASLNAVTQKALKQTLREVPDAEISQAGIDATQYLKIIEMTEYRKGFAMIPRFNDSTALNSIIEQKIKDAIERTFESKLIDQETKSKYLKSLVAWVSTGRWNAPSKNSKPADNSWRLKVDGLVEDFVDDAISLLRNNKSSWVRLNEKGEQAIKDAISVNWSAYASASEGGMARGKLYARISMYPFKQGRVQPLMKHAEDHLSNQDELTKTFYGPFEVVLAAAIGRTICETVYQANKHFPEYFDIVCPDLKSSRVLYRELRSSWINQMDGYQIEVPEMVTSTPSLGL